MKILSSSKSLDEFKTNLNLRYSWLRKLLTIDGVNSYGFRLNEPNADVDVCYFGCSFTFGEYVDAQSVWTKIVDNELNLSSNNFGLPGLSITEILLLFSDVVKFFHMKKAVFLLPDIYRQTIATRRVSADALSYAQIFPNYKNVYPPGATHYEIGEHWFRLPDAFHLDRALTSINLIEQLARYNNIKTYWAGCSSELCELLPTPRVPKKFENDHQAADLRHPGPQSHYNFAQEIIKIL